MSKKENEVYGVIRIHLRKLTKKEYLTLEALTYQAKSIYNNGLYAIKNNLLNESSDLSFYSKIYNYIRKTPNGNKLHSQSIQKIVEQLIIAVKNNGKKSVKYMPSDGHKTVVWKSQSIKIIGNKIRLPLSKGFIKHYEVDKRYLEFTIPEKFLDKKIVEVHLVPKLNAKYFVLKVVYKQSIKDTHSDFENDKVMGIDLGVNNFATIAINDGTAIIIDGRKVKSINQYFNKEKSRLQSIYAKQGVKNGKKLVKLSQKRTNWLYNFMHQTASMIIKIAKEHKVEKIAVGKNTDWKQNPNMGKQNNQNFTSIPHAWFVELLKYKALLNGLTVEVINESHTSKCDALALEPVEHHEKYKGKRPKRGLFKSSTGIAINADVNGAINIARKAFGDKYWNSLIKSIPESLREIGGSGCLTQPLRIRIV